MATSKLTQPARAVWALIDRQHGVVARRQLLDLGYTDAGIRHRLDNGRLFVVHRGVYAVGRRELSQEGKWMAAVLAAGPGAILSHQSAAELWGFRVRGCARVEVCVPAGKWRRRPGLVVHKFSLAQGAACAKSGIPVVDAVTAFVQIAPRLSAGELERAINQADGNDVIDPEALRSALRDHRGRKGVQALRTALDRRTFAMSRSELERRFRPLARRAGLPQPETCVMHNGWEVDFLWRDIGLVVETDSLRYHRTPAQQARDRLRDQAHQAAGDVPLRFTHAQVRYQPAHVERTLRAVVERICSGEQH